ncbi:MAG: GNAT family N-acetyltransferase [Acidobacteriota bacterium]
MRDSDEIVRYGPEFRDQVLRLLVHGLSPDASRNDAYMRWKHERNPYRRDPLIFLARRGREVVGMRSFLATEWQAGSPPETFGALYADDFVIAPEHRNRGVAPRIMETAMRELRDEPERLAINLSAGPVTLLVSLAGGWKSAGPVRPVGRRSRRAKALELAARLGRRMLRRVYPARIMAAAAGTLAPFSRLDRAISRRGGRLAPNVVAQREPRIEAMADLVARLPFDGRVRHVRDARYFSWRFRNPTRDYRFLFWEGERLEGYLVLGTPLADPRPTGRVNIVDWEARDESVREDLLRAALAEGVFPELVTWTATLGPDPRRLLQESGFEPVDAHRTARGIPCILVRPIRQEEPGQEWIVSGRRLLDMANWDLRMIYSMHG